VVGMTLGLGLLSLAVLALAALRLLRPWTLSLLLAGFWVVGFRSCAQALDTAAACRSSGAASPWPQAAFSPRWA